MIVGYPGVRLFWTKHAVVEALEDNFDVSEIEGAIRVVVETPEFEEDKRRGVVKVGNRYCTLIYKKKKRGMVIITCWESNKTDIDEYHKSMRGKKRGVV